MFKKILLVLAGLLVLVLLTAALKSPDFRVERSLTIAAPAETVFSCVNSPKKFNEWNPFLRVEPTAKTDFSGPEAGVGAVSSWEGKQIGKGKFTIIESKPGELVRLRMDFLEPMEVTNTVDFTFKPEGGKTLVTWAMYGTNTKFLAKLFSVFVSCEAMCGPQFEKGLVNLAQVATATSAK